VPLDGQFFQTAVRDFVNIQKTTVGMIDQQAAGRDEPGKMPGGYWKLNAIYTAVSNPEGEVQATDASGGSYC